MLISNCFATGSNFAELKRVVKKHGGYSFWKPLNSYENLKANVRLILENVADFPALAFDDAFDYSKEQAQKLQDDVDAAFYGNDKNQKLNLLIESVTTKNVVASRNKNLIPTINTDGRTVKLSVASSKPNFYKGDTLNVDTINPTVKNRIQFTEKSKGNLIIDRGFDSKGNKAYTVTFHIPNTEIIAYVTTPKAIVTEFLIDDVLFTPIEVNKIKGEISKVCKLLETNFIFNKNELLKLSRVIRNY